MSKVFVSRAHKIGNSQMIAIPKALWDALAWREGSQVAIRPYGEKIVIERIPVEELGILVGAPVGGAR